MPLLLLIAFTYLIVSGGPYGIEEIVGYAGYAQAFLLVAVLPLLWSLPTAFMVGELASMIPSEGGFYVWVTRALGPFWGFMEAWLSLTASIFDMALYPTLFAAYLGQLAPLLTAGHRGIAIELALVLVCVAWNLRGAYGVGESSLWVSVLMLVPFVLLVGAGVRLAVLHSHAAAISVESPLGHNFSAALLVALWNTMGWDNASTIAQDVERPQRTYPRAMIGAVLLVVFSYVLPIAAAQLAHIPVEAFHNGAWTSIGQSLAGPWLAVAITAGGALSSLGMFNSLMLSYSRIPSAMAQDGWLPQVFTRCNRRGVPWAAILALAVCWSLAVTLNFDRLIVMDVTLYGSSLILEFVALFALRIREPDTPRPFKVPGGLPAAFLLGVPSLLLLAYAAYSSRDEAMYSRPALQWCVMIAACGPVLYVLAKGLRRLSV